MTGPRSSSLNIPWGAAPSWLARQRPVLHIHHNAKSQRERDLSAIRWSRLLGRLYVSFDVITGDTPLAILIQHGGYCFDC